MRTQTANPGGWREERVQAGGRLAARVSSLSDYVQHFHQRCLYWTGGREEGAGLAFADDLVVMGDSRTILRKAVVQIEVWARRWEMEINPKKCGIITFYRSEEERMGIHIGEGPIPEVKSYTYLGVEQDQNLTRKAVVEKRRSSSGVRR
ncbi:MAG: uncharacterized protein A8A55_2159 [Amphiamblys sp. WSBS2006]|nr:MAG: uncharacterized protein A8A55_2159 [Amphiamblys sp. WSBS2006]